MPPNLTVEKGSRAALLDAAYDQLFAFMADRWPEPVTRQEFRVGDYVEILSREKGDLEEAHTLFGRVETCYQEEQVRLVLVNDTGALVWTGRFEQLRLGWTVTTNERGYKERKPRFGWKMVFTNATRGLVQSIKLHDVHPGCSNLQDFADEYLKKILNRRTVAAAPRTDDQLALALMGA